MLQGLTLTTIFPIHHDVWSTTHSAGWWDCTKYYIQLKSVLRRSVCGLGGSSMGRLPLVPSFCRWTWVAAVLQSTNPHIEGVAPAVFCFALVGMGGSVCAACMHRSQKIHSNTLSNTNAISKSDTKSNAKSNANLNAQSNTQQHQVKLQVNPRLSQSTPSQTQSVAIPNTNALNGQTTTSVNTSADTHSKAIANSHPESLSVSHSASPLPLHNVLEVVSARKVLGYIPGWMSII